MSTKSKTKSTSSTSAASWAQPYIDDSLKGLQAASGLSQTNAGAVQPYLMQAIQRIGGDLASPPAYMADAQKQLSGLMNGSGTNPYAASLANNPYIANVLGAGSATNPYTQQIASAAEQANPYLDRLTAGTPYADQLSQVNRNQYADALAKGDNGFIDRLLDIANTTNPYADDIAKRIGQDAGAQAAASFGNAGRQGSGLAALLGNQGIGNALGNFRYQQYANDQNLRSNALTAAAQLKYAGLSDAANREDGALNRANQGLTLTAQMQQAGLLNVANLSNEQRASQLQALAGAAGYADNDLNRQLAAANNAAQYQQNGDQNAAQLYDNQQARALQAALAAPGFQQASYAGVDPLMNLANLSTALPLQGTQTYANAVQGVTSPYVTQDATQTTKTGGLGQIASLAMQGLSAAGGIPGLSSGLGSLFGGSGASGGGTQLPYLMNLRPPSATVPTPAWANMIPGLSAGLPSLNSPWAFPGH